MDQKRVPSTVKIFCCFRISGMKFAFHRHSFPAMTGVDLSVRKNIKKPCLNSFSIRYFQYDTFILWSRWGFLFSWLLCLPEPTISVIQAVHVSEPSLKYLIGAEVSTNSLRDWIGWSVLPSRIFSHFRNFLIFLQRRRRFRFEEHRTSDSLCPVTHLREALQAYPGIATGSALEHDSGSAGDGDELEHSGFCKYFRHFAESCLLSDCEESDGCLGRDTLRESINKIDVKDSKYFLLFLNQKISWIEPLEFRKVYPKTE